MSTESIVTLLTVLVHEIKLRREVVDSKRWQVAQKAIETAITILKPELE